MDNKGIVAKNFLKGVLGLYPLGSLPTAILDAIDEINAKAKDEEDEKARNKLLTMLLQLVDRIAYIEENSDDFSDSISLTFNRSIVGEQYDKFSELLCENEIQLSEAEMYPDFDGIDIYLDGEISGYEKMKTKEKMNQLLKEIDSDLEVIEVD